MPNPGATALRAQATPLTAAADLIDAQDATIAALTARLAALTPSPPIVTPAPAPVPSPPILAASGAVTLKGRRILRPNGTEVIARGPEATIASASHADDVDAIAKTGATAMRMLLTLDAANGMTPAAFDAILARAAAHKLLVWVSLYVWDEAAGYAIAPALGGGRFYALGGGSKAAPAACYWTVWQRAWLRDLMAKYRGIVILDAAQEYVGPDMETPAGRERWTQSAMRAVRTFREAGYTQPLEVMANVQGRDLFGIMEHGERIRASDTVRVDGQPQVLFGWQAYWGTTDGWYPRSQGELILGKGRVLSGPDAMATVLPKLGFPVQVGLDAYLGDTNLDWKASLDAAADQGLPTLWWRWMPGEGTVEAPVGGKATSDAVLKWFSGATRG